jgi:hypothetical protein
MKICTSKITLLSCHAHGMDKVIVPSESAPQELSNEWSCQYIAIILKFFGNFCVPPLALTNSVLNLQES